MAKRRKKQKHPKLPNGFGRITEITFKKLRNPYRAMVTVGKNEEGMPIGKILGYYPTWDAAYAALVLYHENPYDLASKSTIITIGDLYKKWSTEYFEELNSATSIRTVTSAWEYVTQNFRKQNAASITPQALKTYINLEAKKINGNEVTMASDNIKSRLKSMFNLMYDYAVLANIVQINPARQFNLKGIQDKIEKHRNDKNPFSKEHEAILWNDMEFGYTRMILINIYTAWRPQELVKLEKKNVDLKNMTIVGGMKTSAGTNRTVPIHPKIQELVRYYYNKSPGEFLFYDYNGTKTAEMTYDKYRGRFKKIMIRHGWDCYSPSCPRHTFSTNAKEARMDAYARKLIMGHEIDDVTDKHYTHLDLTAYISEEILKI